jgi:hypothetical protein
MPIALVALKITLVPLLIGAITLAGRRWGPAVAGWLSGLPVVAGPIMYIMALEHGAGFASNALVGMLLGVFAMLGFLLAYAWASTRWSWRASVLCALSAYFVGVALLNTLDLSIIVASAMVFAVLLVAPRWFPRAEPSAIAVAPPRGEIYVRMAAGALLVLAVTYAAASLGARLSGLLAMFPVISTVLAVFSHRQCGHEFTICLLRGIVFGWYAFLVFCVVLGWALPQLGVGAAFLTACVAASVAQVVSGRVLKRRAARSR